MTQHNSPQNYSFIEKFLRDSTSQDTLAVATEQGNRLATEGLGKDLNEMSYAELTDKYGSDVAQNRFRIQSGTDRLNQQNQSSSSLVTKAKDSALDIAATLYSTAGNTVGALAVKPIAALADVDTGLAAAMNVDLTNKAAEAVRALRSDYANENSRYQAIQAQLDSEDSIKQMSEDIDNGETLLTAAFRKTGRDFLNSGSRVVQDQEAVRELISQSLGSLAPSAAIARGASIAAAKGVGLLTTSARTASMASTSATALAIGGIEASGTYADTLNTVMQMDEDILSASALYAGLRTEGY